MALLAPLSVGKLWGVGKVAEERLARLGFKTIGDLQRLDEADAMRLGDDGRRLWRLARGIDERRVTPERETKSISSETTFENDVADRTELTRVLLAHCERVAARLRKADLAAGAVTLKLRTPDFKLRTRTRSGFAPTQMAPRLFAAVARVAGGAGEGRGLSPDRRRRRRSRAGKRGRRRRSDRGRSRQRESARSGN